MLVNGDFYGAILWNGDTSNVLMSLMSDGKEMRFFKSHVKRSDSTAGLRNELGSEFQTVGPVTEKARGCLMCCDETVDYDLLFLWVFCGHFKIIFSTMSALPLY